VVHRRIPHLSRRERQIMDVLYKRGRATAAEVLAGLPNAPSYSAVRATLRILEEKGQVRHEQEGPRYVFLPTMRRDTAKKSALRHLMDTFFDGSASNVMAALMELSPRDLDEAELERLRRLIDEAKRGKE
jgi:BlaI family penicillinase repressor